MGLKLYRQRVAGIDFIWWTYDAVTYSVVRADNFASIRGKEAPSVLIQKLLAASAVLPAGSPVYQEGEDGELSRLAEDEATAVLASTPKKTGKGVKEKKA